jgi:hypothetical protein
MTNDDSVVFVVGIQRFSSDVAERRWSFGEERVKFVLEVKPKLERKGCSKGPLKKIAVDRRRDMPLARQICQVPSVLLERVVGEIELH